jgi:hypothetical protein
VRGEDAAAHRGWHVRVTSFVGGSSGKTCVRSVVSRLVIDYGCKELERNRRQQLTPKSCSITVAR